MLNGDVIIIVLSLHEHVTLTIVQAAYSWSAYQQDKGTHNEKILRPVHLVPSVLFVPDCPLSLQLVPANVNCLY